MEARASDDRTLLEKKEIREYLPFLTEKQKWKREVRNIAVDDVVLVVDETSPRGRCHMGPVVNTIGTLRNEVGSKDDDGSCKKYYLSFSFSVLDHRYIFAFDFT